MNILKKTLTSLALASAILVAPVTHAAPLINGSFQDGINTIQDSNADRVLRSDGNGGYNVQTTGAFAVGDTLQAILRFDSVNSAAINNAVGTLDYGLWAYSEIKIDTLSAASAGVINVTFTAANILSSGGSMVELYEADSGTNFLTLAADAGITAVRALNGGSPIASFGLSEADDFWSASLPTLISDLGQPLGSGQQPSGAFGLTALTNFGLPIKTNGILSGTSGKRHDVIGDVSAFPRETGVNGDWIVSTNTNISFNKVPEPSNIALLGLGLLGLSMRRQKQAK